jgi:hypothetical protein
MRRFMAVAALITALAGCGESKPPAKTVFQPQVEALQKARAVEQKVLDAAQVQRENVQRQEAGEK